MSRVLRWAAVGALLAPAPGLCENADNAKTPVYVQPECAGDELGQKIASRLHDDIRASGLMSAVDRRAASMVTLNLVCLPPDANERGLISHYSYQITLANPKGLYDFAMSHGVGTCGSQRVSECAASLLANLEKMISELRGAIQSGVLKPPAAEAR